MDHRRDIIKEELTSIAPELAKVTRENVFSTLPFYFQQLAANILEFVKARDLQVSSALTIKNPFRLPEGYFDTLPAAILKKVSGEYTEKESVMEELNTIAPALNAINKQTVYSVPDGYFTSLHGRLPVIKKEQRPVTVIRRIYRFAAAAVVIGILAIGAFFFTRNNNQLNGSENTAANLKKELEKVSDSEITSYLDNNNFAVEVNSANIYLNEELPIDEYIKNLSEEEIRTYLKENDSLKKEI